MNGTENSRIQKTENARDLDHHDIRALFTPINTTPANNTAAEYNALAHMWEVGVEVFANRIKASIDAAWSGGSAAPKAQEAIKQYTDKAHELTPVMQALAGRVGDAASAIVSTQSALPGEVSEKAWWHKDSWPWVGVANDSVVKDRDEDAQTAMETYYVNRFVSLDGQIPVLPTPVDPTSPLDISAPIKSTETGNAPGTPGSSNPGTTGSPTDEPEQAGPEDNKSGDDPTATTPSTTKDTSTTPTTTNNTTSTVPQTTKPTPDTSTVPTTTTPGTPSTPGRTSSPGTPSTPGTSNTPSPGRTAPGTPGTVGATGGPAAAAAARAASAGRAGMPGMGGAGAGRGKSDEESTHEIPDYLINQKNTDELLGEMPRTVPGGVIGGDHHDDR